jgi:NAD(P)-dependent dehydrogenase (short-subunit alcohol dehydrogenase family)
VRRGAARAVIGEDATGPDVLLLGADSAGGRAFARRAQERALSVCLSEAPAADLDEDAVERAFSLVADGPAPLAVVQVVVVPAERDGIDALTLDAWQRGVTGGLRSAFLLARRAVEEFLGGGRGGRIVHLFDVPGTCAVADVTQAALLALVRSVAKEYGPKGVTCNAVLADLREEGRAREAAEVALMLAAPEGAYVTGELLVLPGL